MKEAKAGLRLGEVCHPQELDFAWSGLILLATLIPTGLTSTLRPAGLLQQVSYLHYNSLYLYLSYQGGEEYGGKFSDQVLRLNTTNFKWYEIGRMKEARAWHGMSVVDNLLDACI